MTQTTILETLTDAEINRLYDACVAAWAILHKPESMDADRARGLVAAELGHDGSLAELFSLADRWDRTRREFLRRRGW